MWQGTVVALGVVGFVATANAGDADQTAGAPFTTSPQAVWGGFHVGVNGGFGSSARAPALQTADFAGTSAERLGASSVRGAFGGVQAGYNWQGFFDPGLVFGVEGDLDYERICGTLTAPSRAAAEARTCLNSFGTLRTRIGYAWDRLLFYGTAGVAFGDIENTFFYRDRFGQSLSVDMAATKIGYAAGGGLGFSLTPNWSLKAEYQFMHLEGFSALSSVTGGATNEAAQTWDFGHDYQTIKVGLNFHVGANSQSLN
jgi:outer membrane immunogenic protein